MNNITVDGSYFNNSFGLGGQPGDRTGVAPISLEAIEQVQVNVAPLRRAPGQLRRRRRQHGHAQRHQPAVGQRLSPLPQRVVRRHRGQGPRLQSGRFQNQQHGRVGRRTDPQEQAVRVRQLRETGRHAAALDVSRQHGRRDGGRQRDARARVGPRTPSALLSMASFDYDTGPLREHRQADAGQAVPRQGRLQPEQQQQNQLPLQPSRLEHGRPAVDLGVARYRPQLRHNTTFLGYQTRTTRSSRTTGPASASGTRRSAAPCRTA